MSVDSKRGDESQPTHSRDQSVGPSRNAGNVGSCLLSIAAGELTAVAVSGRILETKLDEGNGLFPPFQFKDRAFLPHLEEVTDPLDDSGPDGWPIALTLNSIRRKASRPEMVQ